MIIGLLGESRSGKDFIKKTLIKNLPINLNDLEIIRAADILKEEAEKRYPDSFRVKDWEDLEDTGYRDEIVIINSTMTISRRKLLQFLGEVLKLEDPNYVNVYLKNSIENSTKTYIIVPDLRNEDEVDCILDNKGIIVKCNRSLKYKYPKIQEEYIDSLIRKEDETESGLLDYIELNYPKIHEKINHHTETSIEEVPLSKVHFNFLNEPNESYNKRLNSLICKLRPSI